MAAVAADCDSAAGRAPGVASSNVSGPMSCVAVANSSTRLVRSCCMCSSWWSEADAEAEVDMEWLAGMLQRGWIAADEMSGDERSG